MKLFVPVVFVDWSALWNYFCQCKICIPLIPSVIEWEYVFMYLCAMDLETAGNENGVCETVWPKIEHRFDASERKIILKTIIKL